MSNVNSGKDTSVKGPQAAANGHPAKLETKRKQQLESTIGQPAVGALKMTCGPGQGVPASPLSKVCASDTADHVTVL